MDLGGFRRFSDRFPHHQVSSSGPPRLNESLWYFKQNYGIWTQGLHHWKPTSYEKFFEEFSCKSNRDVTLWQWFASLSSYAASNLNLAVACGPNSKACYGTSTGNQGQLHGCHCAKGNTLKQIAKVVAIAGLDDVMTLGFDGRLSHDLRWYLHGSPK